MQYVVALLVLCAAFSPSMASAAMPLKHARTEPVENLPMWRDFSARQSRSIEELSTCLQDQAKCASKEIERWAKLVNDLRPQNKLRQIITVNRWFNRLPYKHDEYAYNTLDYWADTQELLQKKGDCEDYALSKYYTLRSLGFTPEELKVVVVYDNITYTNHAVLMVYTNGTRYMLDINADDTDADKMDYRYETIYTFNEKTAWFY